MRGEIVFVGRRNPFRLWGPTLQMVATRPRSLFVINLTPLWSSPRGWFEFRYCRGLYYWSNRNSWSDNDRFKRLLPCLPLRDLGVWFPIQMVRRMQVKMLRFTLVDFPEVLSICTLRARYLHVLPSQNHLPRLGDPPRPRPRFACPPGGCGVKAPPSFTHPRYVKNEVCHTIIGESHEA